MSTCETCDEAGTMPVHEMGRDTDQTCPDCGTPGQATTDDHGTTRWGWGQ